MIIQRPLLLALVLAAFALLLNAITPEPRTVSRSAPDTSRVTALRESLAVAQRSAAARLDSLRKALEAHPDTVWRVARRLVHDTDTVTRIDTLRTVRELVLDDSTCRVRVDSLRGALAVCKASDSTYRAAHAATLPAPVSCPSRASWFFAGAASGALLSIIAR